MSGFLTVFTLQAPSPKLTPVTFGGGVSVSGSTVDSVVIINPDEKVNLVFECDQISKQSHPSYWSLLILSILPLSLSRVISNRTKGLQVHSPSSSAKIGHFRCFRTTHLPSLSSANLQCRLCASIPQLQMPRSTLNQKNGLNVISCFILRRKSYQFRINHPSGDKITQPAGGLLRIHSHIHSLLYHVENGPKPNNSLNIIPSELQDAGPHRLE